ncbi:hypothetical protein ACFW2V_01215 [Streptomyces sp. NPDC058947]|uniref:hypothetical protein n=1 Tax=Streptomyces sp. NPDC058947 TaxID=3346675 RepID=UPI003685523E
MPGSAVILVAYFRVLPGHPAPLLRRPGQAVFLLPTPEFRKNTAAGGRPLCGAGSRPSMSRDG